jgi:hypothetical protein
MANISLKKLLTEAEDFKAKSKETGKLVHFKSKDSYDAALKAGSHEDPDTKKDSSKEEPVKGASMFGADYAKNRGGEAPKDNVVTSVPKITLPIQKKIQNWTEKEKAFFDRNEGAPGSELRRSLGQTLKDKAKGALKAIKKGFKHEVEEFKAAGEGVGKFFKGEKLSEHETKAVKAVAFKVVTTAVFGAALGGTAHGAAYFAKHVAMEFIPHVVGETILKGVGKAAMFADAEGEAETDANMIKFTELIANGLEKMEITPEMMEDMVDSYNEKKANENIMKNISLKSLIEADDFKARSKETGKLVHFKSKDAYQAALKAGSHEDPKAGKGKTAKAAAKPNDMFGGDYAKDRGGKVPASNTTHVSVQPDSQEVKTISKFTSTREKFIADFINKHKLDAAALSKFIEKGSLRDRMDVGTAMVGNPGNKYEKELIKKFGASKSEPTAKTASANMGVDKVVYNTRTKTVGIVRMADERGETKTDADGNVNTSELEPYNPTKYPHQKDAKVAPSTKKEVEARGLWNPFAQNEPKNEPTGETPKYDTSGETDYFEEYEQLPDNIKDLMDKHFGSGEDEYDYKELQSIQKDFESNGWTFDFGLDAEPFELKPLPQNKETSKEEPTSKPKEARKGNPSVNKDAKKSAEEFGITPQKLGNDGYKKVMLQAAVEALTDANFHDEARELISKIEGKPEWAKRVDYPKMDDPKYKEKMADIRTNGVDSSEYWRGDDNAHEFGRKVSSASGWDGVDAADGIAFTLRMNGFHKQADMIQSVFDNKPYMRESSIKLTKMMKK